MKAIETRYKNYRFRSRLEARWAVFFDALDLQWEYEREGFDLNGIWYLPDFWMPSNGLRPSMWLEIKPNIEVNSWTEEDRAKIIAFEQALLGRALYFVLAGSPCVQADFRSQYCCYQVDGTKINPTRLLFAQCPLCGMIDLARVWNAGLGLTRIYCDRCDTPQIDRPKDSDIARFHKGDVETEIPWLPLMTTVLKEAYRAALSARFEHGESPAV